jgi:ubiquinone/menaquinone biosynthesis C-methylase UbiE
VKVDFEREKSWWDAKAPKEEQDIGDEAINRALRWRETERHLEGVETILDVGAGTGAFSIPLARRGFSVTHLDFSLAMLEIARQNAQDLKNIRLVEGNAVDLSQFPDCCFDLVLNMDGAVSFCGSEWERAIFESCRVAKKKLIITVSHRACMAPVVIASSLEVAGRFVPAVYAMLDKGEWHQDQFQENAVLAKGMTQDYFGAFKAFLPGELKKILEQAGMKVLRVGGLGSLAQLCGKAAVERVLEDEDMLQEFLELCERFDEEILPDGLGTRHRAGLIAVAERAEG